MNTQVTRPGHMVPGWKLSPSEAELCKMQAEAVFEREYDHARRMGILASIALTLSLIAAAILLGVSWHAAASEREVWSPDVQAVVLAQPLQHVL